MEYTLEAPMLHRDLHRLGVDIRTYTMLDKIEPGVCHTSNVWNPAHSETFEVDSVVLCTQRISDDELYFELRSDKAALEREGIESLYVIGDASAPRMIVDSIFDGHRLAREIDSPNPAMPLPFIRERRLWGDVDQRRLRAPAAAGVRRPRRAGDRVGVPVKIVVPVKQVAALDDEFELRDDGRGVDPDFIEWDLNEWDTSRSRPPCSSATPARARAR